MQLAFTEGRRLKSSRKASANGTISPLASIGAIGVLALLCWGLVGLAGYAVHIVIG